jgi:hypothetical protein
MARSVAISLLLLLLLLLVVVVVVVVVVVDVVDCRIVHVSGAKLFLLIIFHNSTS